MVPLSAEWCVMPALVTNAAIAVLLLTLVVLPPTGAATERPIVAAASIVRFALPEIAEAFRRETGHEVRLNFGSSGSFRRQIAQGAPYALFLSADETYVKALYADGHTVDEGTLYALGRMAVLAPAGDPAGIVDSGLSGLKRALDEGRIRRFAIANPEHAPYGVAAREVLQSVGLWERIEPYLVYGENVSQATRYAVSGETQGGLVGYALASAPALEGRGIHVRVPGRMHAPIRQRMALLHEAGKTARAFHDFLQQETARTILLRKGFDVPEGE